MFQTQLVYCSWLTTMHRQLHLHTGSCKCSLDSHKIALFTFMVYEHWLTPGPEQGKGTGTGKMGCMRLHRTFHTTQEPGLESGPEKSRMGSKPIFQYLKLNQEMSCNGFFSNLKFKTKVIPHSKFHTNFESQSIV